MQGEGQRRRGEAWLGATFLGAMGEGDARAIERWRDARQSRAKVRGWQPFWGGDSNCRQRRALSQRLRQEPVGGGFGPLLCPEEGEACGVG
jgi:hypothetical protein